MRYQPPKWCIRLSGVLFSSRLIESVCTKNGKKYHTENNGVPTDVPLRKQQKDGFPPFLLPFFLLPRLLTLAGAK